MKSIEALIEDLRIDLAGAMPRWGFSPRAEMSLLSHSENTTFLAKDPGTGEELVLRVQRNGYHRPEEIRSELAWIAALIEDRVVATPRPVPSRDGTLLCALQLGGTARHVVAFERMTGHEPDPMKALTAWFRELGMINARLHRHAATWQRPAWFTRKTWDFDAMLGNRPLWGDWRGAPGLGATEKILLQKVSDGLARRLSVYGSDTGKFGLVHADLRLANLLVNSESLGVIDFDDCGFSWNFYDFAASVSFLEHQPIIPELQAAWLDGYRTIGTISKDDEAMFPVFVMLRRMLLTAWIASHPEADAARLYGGSFAVGTVDMGERFLSGNVE
jgi:Ser/Thr protein kinase RdoA (MazF antagonist)